MPRRNRVYSLTDQGIDVPMSHLPDCPGPKVGMFYGTRGEWVVRCNRCAERRALRDPELSRIREQLANPAERNFR
jgi:hypothetical protein